MKWPLRYGGPTYLGNVTDIVQTVQYSDGQCAQQQYWHKRRRCSWLHAGFYCIAARPFTRFVFFILFEYPTASCVLHKDFLPVFPVDSLLHREKFHYNLANKKCGGKSTMKKGGP